MSPLKNTLHCLTGMLILGMLIGSSLDLRDFQLFTTGGFSFGRCVATQQLWGNKIVADCNADYEFLCTHNTIYACWTYLLLPWNDKPSESAVLKERQTKAKAIYWLFDRTNVLAVFKIFIFCCLQHVIGYIMFDGHCTLRTEVELIVGV